MFLINNLVKIAQQRVEKHGAQYYTFGIFGLINYPLAYFYELGIQESNAGLWLRLIATTLCFSLVLKDKWPQKIQKFLPLYWYFTVTMALPILTSFISLKGNLSIGLMMNFNVGAMILILLVDSVTFLVLEVVGITMGALLFYVTDGFTYQAPESAEVALAAYIFLHIVIVGTIFSRNKEVYNSYILKTRNDMNDYLNEQVKLRTAELQEAIAFKTTFLNNMSHEIRTPVQGITSVADGLVENWDKLTEAKKYECAKMVSGNGKRLLSLVNHLLDISKFNAGMMRLDMETIDMNEIIDEMIYECKTLYMTDKKIDFKFMHTKNALISADRERIIQVLRNLMFNAIKFTKENSLITTTIINSTIVLEDGTVAAAILVKIDDQGAGVPQKELERIFAPFIQSSTTNGNSGGTGLGLTIAQQIVSAHGGRIWVENNVDAGASFQFIIPSNRLVLEKKIQVAKTAIQRNASGVINVLVVDDESSIIAGVEMMLMGSRYNMVSASDGTSALDYLKEHRDIDIILLDLMLPDMSGLDILQEIKRNAVTKHIPVILQSGASDENEVKKARSIGVDHWIKKPYRKNVLIEAFDEVTTNIAKSL